MDFKNYIIIGGYYNLSFVIFHIFFWKIFDWKKQLRLLNNVNKGIMQILNICLILVFLLFAYFSFFFTEELITIDIGKSLLLFIALFWFIRGIIQIYFFGLKNRISLIFFLLFFLGAMIYIYPFIVSIQL